MRKPLASFCRFEPFSLDAVRRVLMRDGESVPLPSKAFDLLLVLVQNSGTAMNKADLLQAVWPDTNVEEGNLSQTIFVLRKALGDRPDEHRYIVTIPGFGYRFVAAVDEDFTAPQGGLPSPGPAGSVRTIAVLPFTGLGSVAGEEYLELGITDALITKLGSVQQVAVRPTTSVLKYHVRGQNPMTAARELRVDAIVNGTIQRSGDRIRVAVHVMRADGATLWAGSFDEHLTDLFAVEDSIANQVTRVLTLTLSEEERQRLAKRSTENTDAYHAYLKGRFFWNKRTVEGLKKGIEFFEAAIHQDPRYAAAYVGLADCFNLLGAYGELPPQQAYPHARAAAVRALDIDHRLAEAHTSLAYASLNFYWDRAVAGREFRQAINLNANYATAHQWYGAYLTALGQFREAGVEIARALMLDPISIIINADVGWLLYFARDYDRAIAQLQKTIELDEHFAVAHWLLGLNFGQKGMFAEATSALERAAALSDDMPSALASLGHVLARSGDRQRAIGTRERLIELRRHRYISPRSIAIIHAGLDEPDEAIAWLNRACDERSDWMIFLNVDPVFDTLRRDSRFDLIARRVGLSRQPDSTPDDAGEAAFTPGR